MNKKTIGAVLVAVVLSVGLSWYLQQLSVPKIAYVRSHDLVYGYDGTKEARAKYETMKKNWQANIDTMKVDFENAINSYNQRYESMSESEKNKEKQKLNGQEIRLQQYINTIEDRSKDEDQKTMQGVLNQVNSFVEQYGKEHDYDVILGTTLSGSVLYGRRKIDITEQLLIELNKEYSGE